MSTYTPETMPTRLEVGDIILCAYSGSAKSVTLGKGAYRLEAYGAQGGYRGETYGTGGLGAYAAGTLTLPASVLLYLLAGGAGSSSSDTGLSGGGYNGGGNATYYGGGGGGASDVRLTDNTLAARILTAGGGGGAQGRASSTYKANGGDGGAETGGDGTYYNGNTTTTYTGKGGTQTAGGACGTYSTYPAETGALGQGGNAGRYYSTTYCGSGAGGGGWYGGGGGAYRYAGGGGGSSHAAAELTDATLTAGQRSGDGLVRITVLDNGAVVPPAPYQTGSTYTSVSIAWDAVEGASGYRLYIDGASSGIAVSGTAYTDDNQAYLPDQAHTYSITAVIDGAESDPSPTLTARTEFAYYTVGVLITAVTIAPNPADINAALAVSVTAHDGVIIHPMQPPYCGISYCGGW